LDYYPTGTWTTATGGTFSSDSVFSQPSGQTFNSALSVNISGTAGGLSGTPTLPYGTTITTPPISDNSTKLQTTAGTLALFSTSGSVANNMVALTLGPVCAHANDAIAPVGITNITYSSPTYTITTSSPLANVGYVPGFHFQIYGTTGGTGNFNVATYTLVTLSGDTVTATSTTATGTAYGSGGTVAMVCQNATDAITGSRYNFPTSLPLPAITTFPLHFDGHIGMTYITSATSVPAFYPPALNYNGTGALTAYNTTTFTANSTTWTALSYDFDFDVLQNGWTFAGWKNPASLNAVHQPLSVSTSSSATFNMTDIYFGSTGLGGTLALTYSSGGTSCTNGTQTVGTFNGGGSGGAGTITVSGGVPTGSVTFTNTGTGYTSIPTTGQVATCTGVTTFTNTGALGGAQGNAVLFWAFGVKQF
jgi:hypothetical protein